MTAASNRVKRDYRVLPVELGTGEVLPTLVRTTDWIPVRVATRWAVRRRRFECMPSTLDHDLRALSILYEWADTVLHRDLDDMLEQFDLPTGRQLDSLTSFLRLIGGSRGPLDKWTRNKRTQVEAELKLTAFKIGGYINGHNFDYIIPF